MLFIFWLWFCREIRGFQEREESRENEGKLETEGPLVPRGRLVRKENRAHLDLQQHYWYAQYPTVTTHRLSILKDFTTLMEGFMVGLTFLG